jgi:hypothetical protein
MNLERKTSSETREAPKSVDPPTPDEVRSWVENGCEHDQTCEACKDHSRRFGAAGRLILEWSQAIGFLVGELKKSPTPVLLGAIDGLSFAISTIADLDILGETLPERADPPASRFQAPPVRRAL